MSVPKATPSLLASFAMTRLQIPGLVLRPVLKKLMEYNYIEQKSAAPNEYYVTTKGEDMFWHVDKE